MNVNNYGCRDITKKDLDIIKNLCDELINTCHDFNKNKIDDDYLHVCAANIAAASMFLFSIIESSAELLNDENQTEDFINSNEKIIMSNFIALRKSMGINKINEH